jgi:Mg2+ and Co2+ transporter CorA
MLIADLDADLAEVRDLLGAEAGRSDEGQHGRIRDFQRSVAVLMSDYLFSLRDWQSESGLKYLLGDAAVFTPREPRRLRTESLSKAMAESIKADAARILDSIEILRDALQVQTALAAARSNERVAETNLTLQVVTIALAALALIAAIVSLSRTP